MASSIFQRIFILLVAFSALSAGQTPDGFSPKVSQQLTVTYGNTTVQPGITLEKALVQSAPRLSFGKGSRSKAFLFIMLDLDVPVRGNNTVVGRQTLLHDLSGNFTASGRNQSLTSSTLKEAPAAYIGPSPPPEDPPVPHRYVQLLFEQPSNFKIPKSQAAAVEKRLGFNISDFISAAGLSAPIGANFFKVVNNSLVNAAAATGTGAAGVTTINPTVAATGAVTTAPFIAGAEANKASHLLSVAAAAGAAMLLL